MIALVIIPAVALIGPRLDAMFEQVSAGFGGDGGEAG